MPAFAAGPADTAFLKLIESLIRAPAVSPADLAEGDHRFGQTSLPKQFQRLVLVLYAPGQPRILVSRPVRNGQPPFSTILQRLLIHPRRPAIADQAFRIQLDFVMGDPETVDYGRIGMSKRGAEHFEIGIDGLLIDGPDGKLHLLLPGDAYIRSIMGMTQLRDYLERALGRPYLDRSRFQRFQSATYLSSPTTWLRLYRGYPLVGPLTKEKIESAVELAIDHILSYQEESGKFLYYYDAALDSKRDHEHPARDPEKNPYYNILRHCGGALTCIYYEKYWQTGRTLYAIRRAIDYLIIHSKTQDYGGRTGAYIYSERKSKLGGAGIALYLAAEYQLLTGDNRYQSWADQLAWHLVNQITSTGEFLYYNIYLDKPVTEAENSHYFSFYYPGEAICGLAKYLHITDPANREFFFSNLRRAMEFLLVVRPQTRASEYTLVPSDSWLMMSIMELWDFPEMRDPSYAEFVFADADKMIAQMYRVDDAPYPDYAGAFYYHFGDYPYADGARCEGLLGAYHLALKMSDQDRAEHLWPPLKLAAWSLMHLVNTRDAVYFARRPDIAVGGIRFKYTRQWFRVDTIQHVASFFAKMLPFWPR